MTNNIINNINYYKTRSIENLKSEQIASIPHLETNQIECVVTSYVMAGKRYKLDYYKHLCIRLKHLKFRPSMAKKRKRSKYLNTNTSMNELVEKKVIQPFALFLDGRFIPWDIVSISISPHASHIIIDISGLDGKFKDLVAFKYAQVLTLPEYVSYSTSGASLENYNVLFSFNDIGEFSTDNVAYSLVMNKTPNICTSYISTFEGIDAYDISNTFSSIDGTHVTIDKCKIFNENVFLFVNGLFSTGIKQNIKRAIDWDFLDHTDEDFTDFAPKLQILQSDEDLGSNPNIKLDKLNLTINNGSNTESDRYDAIICVNTNYSNSIDNIENADNSFIQNIAKSVNETGTTPEYYTELNTPFEMNMDRNTDYSSNIASAIRTMLSYNSNAFKDTFYKSSNLEIIERTGKWVNDTKKGNDNMLWIPRRHNFMNEEFIIMLVNGELYRYDHAIKYKANYCTIPITGIEDSDKIEFLRFKNVNNNTFDITINSENSNDEVYHSSDIINDDLMLFSNEVSHNSLEDTPYSYPIDGKQHFPVKYTVNTNSDGSMRIILEDSFYNGKPLKAAYKNRYIHYQYKIPANETEYTQYYIDLGDKFAFCNDYSRFMIFYNGRKLDSEFYRLVLPVRTTTPFYEFKLYFSIPIKEGDNVDVIYTPNLMKDIVYIPEIDTSGDIIVDKSILNYSIGSELFMVWINGKKIPASCIKDIGANRMHIMSKESSTKNLCITQYIPDIQSLINDFSTTSVWDSVISKLTNEEIYNMLGISTAGLKNSEPSINGDAVDIKTIMYEIIREWYLANPRVDTTKPFVYDYLDVDQSVIEGFDNGGNAIIPVMDGNKMDNLNGTVWSESNT